MRRFLIVFTIFIAILFTACDTGGRNNTDNSGTVITTHNDSAAETVLDFDGISVDNNVTTPVAEEKLTDCEVTISVKAQEDEASIDSADNTEQDAFLPFEIHYIDVGEADSALIICGDDAMLVDSGNPDQGTAIRLYLKKHNVSKLRYMLLTHSDRDHIGGAASVISNIDVENLFMCRYEKDNDIYKNLINEIGYKNLKWSTPQPGSEYKLGDATISIIAPNRDYDNPNDSSIAFIVRHGNNSFAFTGDAEAEAEEDITNNGMDISAKVYYVGHHGSSTSTAQIFLDKMAPEYAVISCGKDNEYGHPHIETMEKLKAKGVKLFRTDDQGTIIASSDGENITFNTEPSDNWLSGNAELAESASAQVKQAIAEATVMAKDESEKNNQNDKSTDTVNTAKTNNEDDTVTEITYICNTNSKKFHRPGCDSVNDMAAKNKMEVTWTREEAINNGYVPCKRCKP